MSGKALLILVVGFTMIFLVMGYLWESVATRSVENHTSYYKNTVARNIAVSGANIALSEVLRDSNWVSDISDRPFENGLMKLVTISPLDSIRILVSTGEFMDAEQVVRVKLGRGQRIFEEYAWFIPSVSTGSLNRPWITGDSVWGGFHTNQFLVVNGDPVFFGKVTSLKGIQDQAKKPNVSDPEFLGGYQSGVNVAWDAEMTFPDYATQAQAGKVAGGECYYPNSGGPQQNLWLEFDAGGNVTYRVGTSNPADDSSQYGPPQTMPITEFAPTGVVYLNKGNVFVSGTFKGELTIVCEGAAGGNLQSGQGNVGLVGDLVYETDPMIPNGSGGYKANPECDDLLGIIATNSFTVSTSTVSGGYANNVANPDVRIDAGIFCVKGGFNVEGLNTLPGPTGSIYLQGSMTAGMEEMVAQFSGNTITKGYNRHVIFDSRFAITPPTWYTFVTYFKVLSWLE